ncbi:hypothetical protein C8J57DRAFT_1235542 [Mycena rebaudengoi]|nr:hypothetical protein C8J57DRAFT_1235542 [Mycena rebaudengoi]
MLKSSARQVWYSKAALEFKPDSPSEMHELGRAAGGLPPVAATATAVDLTGDLRPRAVSRRPVELLKKFLTGRHGQRDGRDGSTGCGTCEVPTVSFSGFNCGGGCRYSQYLSAHRDRYDANDARERMPHQNFRELTNTTPTSEFGDCRNRSKLTGTWNFWGKIREDRDRGR